MRRKQKKTAATDSELRVVSLKSISDLVDAYRSTARRWLTDAAITIEVGIRIPVGVTRSGAPGRQQHTQVGVVGVAVAMNSVSTRIECATNALRRRRGERSQ
jgi:hypothetical protein